MATNIVLKGSPTDILGTGRRKTSVGRVRVRAGKGVIVVNNRPFDSTSTRATCNAVLAPLLQTNKRDDLDVSIRVDGGGITGQADACKLGLARARRSSATSCIRPCAIGALDPRRPHERAEEVRPARRAAARSSPSVSRRGLSITSPSARARDRSTSPTRQRGTRRVSAGNRPLLALWAIVGLPVSSVKTHHTRATPVAAARTSPRRRPPSPSGCSRLPEPRPPAAGMLPGQSPAQARSVREILVGQFEAGPTDRRAGHRNRPKG